MTTLLPGPGVQGPLCSSGKPPRAHTMLLNREAAVGSGAGDVDDVRSQQGLVTQLEREVCNAILRDHILPPLYLVVLGVLRPQERKSCSGISLIHLHSN